MIIFSFSDRKNAYLLKGKRMQICKSTYKFVFIQKQYSGNFVFLIPRILELFVREFCKFLKKWANF